MPPNHRSSPLVQSHPEVFNPQTLTYSADPSSLTMTHNLLTNPSFPINPANPVPNRFNRPPQLLHSSYENPSMVLFQPPPLQTQDMFRTLHSNGSPLAYQFDHYQNLSVPPDLFGALSDPPSSPSSEDMKPEDTDLTPHEQDLRFDGDLYTPKYVRGHGNKREGWCGICKPGRWLVLKNSAFWYDKSFTHGISAATGVAFEGPKDVRRMESNAEVWEGLCGCCGDWIALVSSKKKGTTWFRHAYKVRTFPSLELFLSLLWLTTVF